MAPTRTSSDNAARRRLPFKPPSRVSSASDNSTPNASRATRKSNASTVSKRTSMATTTFVSSDNEEDDTMEQDEPIEEVDEDGDVDNSVFHTTVASRRTTIASRGPTTPRRQSTAFIPPEETGDAAAILRDDEDAPTIPRKLLSRLLYEGFEDKDMRISKEAMSTVDAYVKLFVKETIARCREESRKSGRSGTDEGWLQVEDLEKVAPQLRMEF